MHWMSVLFLLLLWSNSSTSLVCYNCSTMFREWSWCGGDFAPTELYHFNTSSQYLVNCTGHNSMCFVRAWSARAQHSWLVQRGCYQPPSDDPLPRSLHVPTRAMTCKHEKLPEAEYKVCLCQADWCNSGSIMNSFLQNLINFIRNMLLFI